MLLFFPLHSDPEETADLFSEVDVKDFPQHQVDCDPGAMTLVTPPPTVVDDRPQHQAPEADSVTPPPTVVGDRPQHQAPEADSIAPPSADCTERPPIDPQVYT